MKTAKYRAVRPTPGDLIVNTSEKELYLIINKGVVTICDDHISFDRWLAGTEHLAEADTISLLSNEVYISLDHGRVDQAMLAPGAYGRFGCNVYMIVTIDRQRSAGTVICATGGGYITMERWNFDTMIIYLTSIDDRDLFVIPHDERT